MDVSIPRGGVDFFEYVARVERSLIRKAMARSNGKKADAAKLLRINRTTLVMAIKRLKMEDEFKPIQEAAVEPPAASQAPEQS